MGKKSLSEILGSDSQNIKKLWDETEGQEYTPLPKGEYTAVVIAGENRNHPRTGTPEYVLHFEVTEGEHRGRKIWHHLYLTPAAIPRTKIDLKRIGIVEISQLDQAPPRVVCKVKLALRAGNDGSEYNRVVSFEAIGPEKADPFAVPVEGAAE